MTVATAQALEQLDPELKAFERPVDQAEAPTTLTRYLAKALLRALGALKDGALPADSVNALLLQLLQLVQPGVLDEKDLIHGELRELLAIVRRSGVTEPLAPPRPGLSLNSSALLVNARGEHRIGAEIFKELQTADRVDLLCSFLKWSGYRLLREPLRELVQRGCRLRVITTCYLGATDVEVLEELAQLGEVRVSYDGRRTRLHAKAWFFHRESGYSTAYIGSSNLSSAALVDGLEWNVRLSQAENRAILDKFQGTFESYWEDGEFETYQSGQDKARYLSACRRECTTAEPITEYALEVRPYPFQQEILERLDSERLVHGRTHNLVVAATGCGKTVIAALDYRRYLSRMGPTRLLFVAHRDEILSQSLQTFRAVLKDGQFGDKWTGKYTPEQDNHLFASIQKLHRHDLSQVRPDHFDIIIVDEFHHAEAPTYRRLLEYFKPKILLGLTATPERSDGQSLLGWFDGRIAAELRVWDALERGFLSPFHYFGIHDNTDLTGLRWARGYDPGELDGIYTGNHARARLIWKQVVANVNHPSKMRALGFCAGVAHARFMADQFCQAGVAATAVVGATPEDERRAALRQLSQGQLQAIFTVDVFNEGLDVPSVDTVLLLRPTESATIFVQQIGRGLRLAEGKECLTVLDFIGQANQQFRFDLMYKALLGGTRKELQEQVEQGFPTLPSGCSIKLDRIARQVLLDNLKRQLFSRQHLIQELREVGPEASLADFLARTGTELTDIYRGQMPGWVPLRRQVGYAEPCDQDAPLFRGVSRLLHMDSPVGLQFYQKLLGRPSPPVVIEPFEHRLSEMLRFSLWSGTEAKKHRISDLWNLDGVRQELCELLPLLRNKVSQVGHPLPEHPDTPLFVHCHYSLAEILAAFGLLTDDKPHLIREGVYHHKPSNCDLFFITIRKSERDYSPSTMYQDYALSPELFHWQSQNITREDSPVGLRYRSHRFGSSHALLFVRETLKEDGVTAPYVFLGPAEYVSHQGERPMAIVWKLKHRIPIQFYRAMKLAV